MGDLRDCLVEGKFYLNHRRDALGPMRLVEHAGRRTWLDQYGGLYEDNGFQVNHVKGSTANIVIATASEEPYPDPPPPDVLAIARQLSGGIQYDHAIVENVIADGIMADRAARSQALPPQSPLGGTFEGIAKRKLDDLIARGWTVDGYAITKDGKHGFATTGAFVGWWLPEQGMPSGDRPGADRAGWQPIETAPKDGQKFDGWQGGGRVPDVYWSDVQEAWCVDGSYGPEEPSPLPIVPPLTYWQPLPASPKESR